MLKPDADQREKFESIDLDDTTLQLHDKELGIGQAYLAEQKDCLDSTVKRMFFNEVRDFYKAVPSTIIKKITFKYVTGPLKTTLNAAIINFQ